jgi:hypothetical protein
VSHRAVFACRLGLVALLCAAGCSSTHRRGGNPELVDESATDAAVDEQDSGVSMDGGRDAAVAMDGGATIDGGRDGATDADVDPDDAGEDASILECTGPLPPVLVVGSAGAPHEVPLVDGGNYGLLEWNSRAFFRITGATPGEHYTVTAEGDVGLVLAVFEDDDTFTQASCIEQTVNDESSGRAVCDVIAARDVIDVTLDALDKNRPFTMRYTQAREPEGL